MAALVRIVATGKKTKMMVSAMMDPIAPITKTSPRHQPRSARPWHRSISKDAEVSAAPRPMPAWLGPGVPNIAPRKVQLQPLSPIARPCITMSPMPARPAATNAWLLRAPGARRDIVASSKGKTIGASHQTPVSPRLAALRGPSANKPASHSSQSPPSTCQGRTANPAHPSASHIFAVRRAGMAITSAGSSPRCPTWPAAGGAPTTSHTLQNQSRSA